MKVLKDAIYAKYLGNDDLVDALTNGLHFKTASPRTEFPYATYFVVSDVPNRTFTERGEHCVVQFSIFSNETDDAEVENIYNKLIACFDDCRASLFVEDYYTIYVDRELSRLLFDDADNIWHYVITYRIELQEKTACARQFGGNWQRKVWHTHPNFWRGRYDIANDRLIFEWIAEDDLAGDNWAENENARIDASGFDSDAIDADFTVRGGENGIPTTIHYSDGIDTYIAESDEASATGWAWENSTKVFDGNGGTYKRVGLASNRQTSPRLWVTAVFDDDTNIYVKGRLQTTSLDITGWEVAVDVSDTSNTDTIWGQSIRSMGETGAEKKDMIAVWKEGQALLSSYFNNTVWEAIQTIEATAAVGVAQFDLEHGVEAGEKEAHVLFVDADGKVYWTERDAGASASNSWDTPTAITTIASGNKAVGICEHGDGNLHIIWLESNLVRHRTHTCGDESWSPTLANDPSTFDPSTEGVVNTTTICQAQTLDNSHSTNAVLLAWIGCIGVEECELGWGVFVAAP